MPAARSAPNATATANRPRATRRASFPKRQIPCLRHPLCNNAGIGLGDQHLYDEMAHPIEGRCIPFISMPELDEEAREVYSLWASKSDKIVFSRSD